jgi:hypothetical protein
MHISLDFMFIYGTYKFFVAKLIMHTTEESEIAFSCILLNIQHQEKCFK